MKRLIALSSLLFLAPVFVYAQAKSDRERDGLKGAVQSVRIRRSVVSEMNGKRNETPSTLFQEIAYNRAGRRAEIAFYDDAGAPSRRIVYDYDAATDKLTGLTTFNARNAMVRRTNDAYDGAFMTKRIICDYNEDGSFLRKLVLTFAQYGELSEVAEYKEDGTLVKRESAPFVRSEFPKSVMADAQNADHIIRFDSKENEFLDPDSHGNWTRAIISNQSLTYASGKKERRAEIYYREFTYFQ